MNDHIFKTGRILGAMVMLALLTGLFCLPVLAADNLGGGRKVIPPAVVDPATGESLVFIASDWKTYHPFAERYLSAERLQAAGDHVIDLAAFQFATDRLVSKDRAGRKSFAYPDLGSFQPSLVKRPFTAGAWDYFIVQADSPDGQTALRQHLEQSGIAILGYLPRLAYLVRLDNAGWKALEQRPEVYWMGLYQPAFRIYPKLEWVIEADPLKELEFTAHFDPLVYPEFEGLFDVLSRINLDITDYDHVGEYWRVRFAGASQKARILAAVPGCMWVERFIQPKLHNNVARTSTNTTTGRGATAGPIMDVEDVWARGIRGEGQIASAADTGLSTGNLSTLHRDFGQQGSSTNPMRVIKGYDVTGRGTWDDNQTTGGGHGTHTSGSIVGNGFRSGSNPSTNTFPSSCFAGTAPQAQFVFQSIMNSSGGLSLPTNLNNLFSDPYSDGARVHSNSWGSSAAGEYTDYSSDLDEFTWNNKDMVITFSAGNDGGDGYHYVYVWPPGQWQCQATGYPQNGIIDQDSMGAPATAKNCITVGASENYRPDFVYEYPEADCTSTGGEEQKTWGWFDGCSFEIDPLYSDFMADNANGMGAFSSRGPCDDGRIKPDIVAPGIAIISTRTDLNQDYEQWGICNVPSAYRTYYVAMGGTSMANPLTAGAATLVRQYYVDGWHPNNSSTTNSSAVSGDAFNPSSALVKATLINGAWNMNPGQYGTGSYYEIPPGWDSPHDLPNNAEGFGRVDLEHSLFPGSGWGDDSGRRMAVYDVTPGLQTSQTHSYSFYISNANDPFIVTLVWTDPWAAAASGTCLINNMDLEVYAPGGTRYYPNRKDWTGGTQDSINNVEQVYVSSPSSGTWNITVRGTNVPGNGTGGTNTQPYALVMSGVSCLALAAPTGVTATANSNNSILVDWNSVSGAVQYKVYRSTTSGGPYSLLTTVSAPATDYSDNDIPGGITYYYVVTSYGSGSSACDSGYSSEASATAQGACNLPPVFAGLGSVSTPGDAGCTLNLSWSEATTQCGGNVTYSIYRSTASGFNPGVSNRIAVGITGSSYQDVDGLSQGTTYYYIVRATDEGNGVEETNSIERSGAPIGAISDTTWTAGAEPGDPAMSTNGSWSISSTRRRTGSYSYFSGYSNNLCAYFRTPSLTLTTGQVSVLTFWTAYDIENKWDGGVVEISSNGGTSWTRLTPTPNYPGSFQNAQNGCSYTGNCFTSTNLIFTSYTVNLSSYNGQTVLIRWNFSTDRDTTPEGWYVDDITITHVQQQGACTGTPSDVLYLTATATSGSNKLEWVNPSGSYTTTRIRYRTDTYPTGPTDGTLLTDQAGAAGEYDSLEHLSLTNGTTYYYAAFVYNGSAYSSGKTVAARPFDTTGAVKWAYSTGATALAPPGVNPGAVGAGGVYAVSNDRNLHATNPSAAGGDWPRAGGYTWEPMAMNGPAQDRPAVVPTELVSGADEVAFVGSQDGYVYAADAETGALLWTSASLGEVVQAAPSAMFTAYGGDYDLVFAATRSATSENKVYALNPATGATLFSFNNGGGANAMGIISGGVLVDYDTNRVYFASRAKGGGSSHTVWCLSFNGSAFAKVWSQPLGDIDGVPVVWNGRVFVGTNAGVVYCLSASDGATQWSYNTGTSTPVKAYLFPTYTATPHRLFFSTSNNVYCITDDGGANYTVRWTVTDIPSPSTPLFLFGTSYIYVGSSDGRLYQINITTGAHTSVALTPGVTPAPVVGSPAYDYVNRMVYVGTDTGVMYAVSVPLP